MNERVNGRAERRSDRSPDRSRRLALCVEQSRCLLLEDRGTIPEGEEADNGALLLPLLLASPVPDRRSTMEGISL